MNKKLTLIKLKIDSDGDFHWDIASHPRHKDKYGELSDEVSIFLENGDDDTIANVVHKLSLELLYSIEDASPSAKNFIDEAVEKMRMSVYGEKGRLKYYDCDGEITDFREVNCCYGNWELELQLFEVSTRPIICTDTGLLFHMPVFE